MLHRFLVEHVGFTGGSGVENHDKKQQTYLSEQPTVIGDRRFSQEGMVTALQWDCDLDLGASETCSLVTPQPLSKYMLAHPENILE